MSNSELGKLQEESNRRANPKEARRLLAIKERVSGQALSVTAAKYGVTERTVRLWDKLYEQGGWRALLLKPNSTRLTKLTNDQRQRMRAVLRKPPEKAGLPGARWTISLTVAWLRDTLKEPVSASTVRRELASLGLRWDPDARRWMPVGKPRLLSRSPRARVKSRRRNRSPHTS
jgi:transposase